ncbi:MAG: RagB/SusD family nutrient uptake outer membrane protein [Niabella sp.]
MQSRYFILILFVTLIVISGCKKFLEEKPYSFVTTENFYKTADDAELAITAVYDALNARVIQGIGTGGTWAYDMQYLISMGCDELAPNPSVMSSQPDLLSISNYSYIPANSKLPVTWFFLYAGINRADFVLEKVPDISMNQARKKEILAEAHCLRGIYYLYLSWLWGGVPLANSSASDQLAPRSTIEEVAQQAESDLKYAYDSLSDRNSIDPARVNKYAAESYLAKLYLYLASCKENNVGADLNFSINDFSWVDQSAYYNKALTACDDIYHHSGYQLIDSFKYLFLAATEAEARNEHIMVAEFGGRSDEYYYFFNLAGPTGNYLTVGGVSGWMRPVKEAYNRFNKSDDRINTLSGNIAATATYVTINGLNYYTPQPISSSLSNLCLNKWREDDPAQRAAEGIPAMGGETDWGLLRYADIILMYAECKYKTGDEAGARQLLEEVRARAAGNDAIKLATLDSAYYKSDFMDELMDERSRELLAEGWRRFDLIRTGRLKSVVTSLDETAIFTNEDILTIKQNFADYKIWYPIPYREVSTNTNLVQNIGY